MKRFAGLLAGASLVGAIACGASDPGITTAVKTKMAADPVVKAYQVDVTTRNGIVTLTGDVNTSSAREQALRIARGTDGVTDVIDRLNVTDVAATSGRLERFGGAVATDKDTEAAAKRGAAAATSGTVGAAESVGDAAKRAAKATGEAAEKAGKATADAAKKATGTVRDAVTDNERDSDRDGR